MADVTGRIHEQVIVKVNMPVDRGVVPLVEAMNQSSRILTVNSCEADEHGRPYVDFLYGHNLNELVSFVELLAAGLARIGGYFLSIEWYGEDPQPRGRLIVRPERLSDVAAGIGQLLNCDHMTLSDDGTQHIGPRR